MFKRISIRWRLTLVSAMSLALCCLGLTLLLNVSAFTLADELEAAVPATDLIDTTTGLPVSDKDSATLKSTSMIPLEDSNAAKKGFRSQSLWYMILIVLGGSALTYYLSGKALQPLDDLADKVRKITAETLSNTLEIPETKDEIAELTQSFKKMKDQLNTAFLTQKRFAANAAHELRTPLTIIQTKIDVFKKKTVHTDSEYGALIAMLEKQIGSLRALVKNLLDLTILEDDRERSSVYLHDILEDILGEFSGLAKQKNITLSLTCRDESVIGNVDLLYRAFYNLIENAIKYNVEGGRVEVVVMKTVDNKTLIQIKDTGIGIPDTMKKHIFEPFYRVDKSRSRAMGGAGLGLSIVENIIKVQGGSIQVRNYKTRGTCFDIIM